MASAGSPVPGGQGPDTDLIDDDDYLVTMTDRYNTKDFLGQVLYEVLHT